MSCKLNSIWIAYSANPPRKIAVLIKCEHRNHGSLYLCGAHFGLCDRFRTQHSPPHFYGEITKTEGGCSLLREKGHFHEFARFIEEHAEESFDQEILLKLKSVLWAVVSMVF